MICYLLLLCFQCKYFVNYATKKNKLRCNKIRNVRQMITFLKKQTVISHKIGIKFEKNILPFTPLKYYV